MFTVKVTWMANQSFWLHRADFSSARHCTLGGTPAVAPTFRCKPRSGESAQVPGHCSCFYAATGWLFDHQPRFGRCYSMQNSRFRYNRRRCHPSISPTTRIGTGGAVRKMSFRNRALSKNKRARTFRVRTLRLCCNSLGAKQPGGYVESIPGCRALPVEQITLFHGGLRLRRPPVP